MRKSPVTGWTNARSARSRFWSNRLLSAAELADVVAEPVLNIAGAVKAAGHQRLDFGLGRGTSKGCDEGVPFRSDVSVGGQARHINQALGLGDRLLVERGNPH